MNATSLAMNGALTKKFLVARNVFERLVQKVIHVPKSVSNHAVIVLQKLSRNYRAATKYRILLTLEKKLYARY